MNNLLLYSISYVLLILVMWVYFERFHIQGVDVTKQEFIVYSLIVPFLILIQWTFETLFGSKKSVVFKTMGLLLGLGLAFTLLFFSFKFVFSHLLTKTTMILLFIATVLTILFSIPQTKDYAQKIASIALDGLKSGYRYVTSLFTSTQKGEKWTFSQKVYGSIITLTTTFFLFHYYGNNIINAFLMPRYKILLSNPVYLDREKKIGTTENTNMKPIAFYKDADKQKVQLDLNYNYALSFLVTLNPQGGNTRVSYGKFTKILDFGENPVVYFNSKTQQLKFEFYEDDTVKEEVVSQPIDDIFKYQKWNVFVLNTRNGNLDVFLNGKVIYSRKIVNKYKIDEITCGDVKGLEGGIKNVVFYNHPLKLYQIHLLDFMYK